MEEYEQTLLIPKDRIAVLVGKSGETKKKLQKATGTRIRISREGEVSITGDSIDAWNTRRIVKAIARGFSPQKAFLLLDESYTFEILELKDWASTNKSELRLKGRVIGERGRSKKIIENLTESYISVYGKTISIIGESEKMPVIRQAVEMLLSGSRHATVFKMLENENLNWRKKELLGE